MAIPVANDSQSAWAAMPPASRSRPAQCSRATCAAVVYDRKSLSCVIAEMMAPASARAASCRVPRCPTIAVSMSR
jgi:hypothetical protein